MATSFPAITKEVADIIAALSQRWQNPPPFQDVAWSMNMRVYRAMERLARYGLNLDVEDLTFADICQFSEKDLLRMYNFGSKSLEQLRAKLSEFGWKLADRSHSPEELNSRFRSSGAPMWWDWDGSISSYLSTEAHKERCKEWEEQLARLRTEPTFSIPTDPEARAEWLRTGKGLIEHPPVA